MAMAIKVHSKDSEQQPVLLKVEDTANLKTFYTYVPNVPQIAHRYPDAIFAEMNIDIEVGETIESYLYEDGEKVLTIMQNRQVSLTPEQYLDAFYEVIKNKPGVPSRDHWFITEDYRACTDVPVDLSLTFVFTTDFGTNGGLEGEFKPSPKPMYPIGVDVPFKMVYATKHTVYDFKGSIAEIYYTDKDNHQIEGVETEIAHNDYTDLLLQMQQTLEALKDSQGSPAPAPLTKRFVIAGKMGATEVEGTEIIVTVIKGLADISVNDGDPVLFGDISSVFESAGLQPYKTEPDNGRVSITTEEESIVYVSYRPN